MPQVSFWNIKFHIHYKSLCGKISPQSNSLLNLGVLQTGVYSCVIFVFLFLSMHYLTNARQGQLKEGRTCFGSQCEATVCHRWEGMATAGHIASTSRKQRQMNAGIRLASPFPSFYSVQDCSPREGAVHTHGGSDACIPGDSMSTQVDNEDKPPPSMMSLPEERFHVYLSL